MVVRTWLLAVLLAMPAAHAQMFKCVGTDGKTSYQSEPCPEAAKGQRLGGSKAAAAPGRWKEGWTPEGIEFMAAQCRDNVIIPARKGYANHKVPFPEQLNGEVARHCDCVANRLGITYTLAEYRIDTRAKTREFNREAAEACPPEGLHAELVKRGWETQ